MKENYIQEKIENLLPFFRGLSYDANLCASIDIVIPKVWNYNILGEKNVILDIKQLESSVLLKVGNRPDEEKPIDEFILIIEEVFEFNRKEERKRKLLEEQIIKLRSMPLEEIEKLDLPIYNLPPTDLNIPSSEVILNNSFNIPEPIPAVVPEPFNPYAVNNNPQQRLQTQQPSQRQIPKHVKIPTSFRDFNNIEKEMPEDSSNISMDGISFNPMPDINNLNDDYEY